ncbi:hypothetical protein MPSEU_001036000 [Mayamaea pseudoterrestris]|nr:hypothetical protein MPSEU_001036000 [Mayamaea pseudoterrestris]
MESSSQLQSQQGLRSRPHDDDCHDSCHDGNDERRSQQQQQHVGDTTGQGSSNRDSFQSALDSSSGYQSPGKQVATTHDDETALAVNAAARKNRFNMERNAIVTMIPLISEHASPHRAANLASVTVTLQDDQAQEPHHQQSAQKRRKRRAPSQAATTVKGDPVETPGANDILCGRGKHIAEHVGCLRFRALIREQKSEYNVHRFKYEKGALARQVLEQVASMDPPGRFLSQGSDGLWRDVSATKALEKVSQALREKKWDHPIGASSKCETEAVDRNADAERNVNGSDKCNAHRRRERLQLAPNHPNSHISPSDMRRRVRAGARVSVYDPSTDTYSMGVIRKRLSTRLQVEMFHAASGAPNVRDVDLNRDKIRIDSRKLVMNSRNRKEDRVMNDERIADGGSDDDDQPLPLDHASEQMIGGTACEYAHNRAQIQNT